MIIETLGGVVHGRNPSATPSGCGVKPGLCATPLILKGGDGMNPDYGKGQEIAEIIEDLIKMVATLARLEFKTPPHDVAAWVVTELTKRR